MKRYTDKCENAYACLEDDGYVFQKLPFHIAASGEYSSRHFGMDDKKICVCHPQATPCFSMLYAGTRNYVR